MEFIEAVRETGLESREAARLTSDFSFVTNGNPQLDQMYAAVLRRMDPTLRHEITHCIDITRTVGSVVRAVLAYPEHRRALGFNQLEQKYLVEAQGLMLTALFHDVALGLDRQLLIDETGQKPLHRWDKNLEVREFTDDYRGGILLERGTFGDTGLPDAAVRHAIKILKRKRGFDKPWQGLLKFGDSVPYLNGDNDARALIEMPMLGDIIDSFQKGDVDEQRLRAEVNFWHQEGLLGYVKRLSQQQRWDEPAAERRMAKKGFTMYDYIRKELPEVHGAIVREANAKERQGFVAPNTWAIASYKAVVEMLGTNWDVPVEVKAQLSEMQNEALKYCHLYEVGQ